MSEEKILQSGEKRLRHIFDEEFEEKLLERDIRRNLAITTGKRKSFDKESYK
jgi:hypothetical protein